jgi:hypothetical protein
VHEAEIGGIEGREPGESLEVQNLDPSARPGDQARAAEFLNRAVHVDGRKAQHFGNLLLADGKFELAFPCDAGGLEAKIEFADEVGEMGEG